ncbi:lycopene cyclase family protein [Saccharomonospora sp. NPDC006951]
MADVAVMGAGPAGRAIASACARNGLDTVLVDPAPRRPWHNVYAVWKDELPHIPDSAVAATADPALVHIGEREIVLPREYAVLDNTGLRHWLSDDRVTVHTGIATAVAHGPHGSLVRLSGGGLVTASVVIDARGLRPGGTEQTAYGVVLPAAQARRLAPSGAAVFMDWRRNEAAGDAPSFRYLVPLGRERVLVEETSLARKPGLGHDVLAHRLRAFLGEHGISTNGRPEERVRIRLDVPLPKRGRTVPFGAAAGLVHPATGYSVAASLRLAPPVAAAIAGHLASGPASAAAAARRVIWPPRALAVHALRRHALHALGSLPAAAIPEFFGLFFALAPEHQRTFLSERDDPRALAATMALLFASAPWRLRRSLLW